MFDNLNRMLYFYGLKITKQKQEHEVIIQIDSENNIQTTTNTNQTDKWTKYKPIITNIIHIFAIFCLIGWESFYVFINAIVIKNAKYFLCNIFSLMYLSQYLSVIWYIKKIKFGTIIKNEHLANIVLLCNIIISNIIPVLTIIFVVCDIHVNVYSDIYKKLNTVSSGFLCLLLYLSKYFSYSIFFVNVTIFTLIFMGHCFDIQNYVTKLNDIIDKKTTDVSSNMIINDFCELKERHSMYVTIMNSLFSFVTFFGIIGSYFVLVNFGSEYTGALNYIDIGCFVLIESIYLYTITSVKRSVGDIQKIIFSQKYILHSLAKLDLEEMPFIDESEPVDKKINGIKLVSIRNMIKIHEVSESIDWLVLNKKLEEPWDNFHFMGFEIQDVDIVKQLSAIIIGILMLFNVNNMFGIKLD